MAAAVQALLHADGQEPGTSGEQPPQQQQQQEQQAPARAEAPADALLPFSAWTGQRGGASSLAELEAFESGAAAAPRQPPASANGSSSSLNGGASSASPYTGSAADGYGEAPSSRREDGVSQEAPAASGTEGLPYEGGGAGGGYRESTSGQEAGVRAGAANLP
jgi:hypothetical protein